jgi:hypothetical protein
VRRLLQGGDIEDDASFEIAPELSRLQDTLSRDGLRRVDGPGRVRQDCPENAVADAGRECLVYGLSGMQTRPVSGSQAINGLLRIWVRPADDGWEVNHYQYDLRLYEVGG